MDEIIKARHEANRADLFAAKNAMVEKWKAEDAVLKAERAAMMASFDQGLRDFEEATGLRSAAPAVDAAPEPEPVVEPVVEAAPEPVAEPAPVAEEPSHETAPEAEAAPEPAPEAAPEG